MRTATVVTGAGCAVVALLLPEGFEYPDWPTPANAVVALSAALSAAAWLRRRRASHARWAVLPALAGMPFAGFWLHRDLTGMPGSAVPVLVVGLLSTVIGILAPAGDAGRRRSMAAAASVAVLAAAAGWLVPGTAVRSQTTTAVAAPAVLERPGSGHWFRTMYEGPDELRAAGTGVIYADHENRVVGIDGRTGANRWSYARRGARPQELWTSPDGRTVVAIFVSGYRVNAWGELVVLDAFTGRPLWQRRADAELGTTDNDEQVLSDPAIAVTENLVVFRDAPRPGSGPHAAGLHAFDLRTGRARWTLTSAGGCDLAAADLAGAREAVIATGTCPGTAAVLALDEDDGSPLWRYERHDTPALSINGSGDGALVAVRSRVAVLSGAPPRFTGLLDATTGTLLAEGPAAVVNLGGAGTRWQWNGRYATRPAQWPSTAGRSRLPSFACMGPAPGYAPPTYTTRHTYLALCRDDHQTISIVAQDLTDGRVVRRTRVLPAVPAEFGGADTVSVIPAPGAVVAVVSRCRSRETSYTLCRTDLLGFPQ